MSKFRVEIVYDFTDEANVILGCLFDDNGVKKLVTYRDKDERVKFISEREVEYDMENDMSIIALVDTYGKPLGLVNTDLNIDIRIKSMENVIGYVYCNSHEYVPNIKTDHVELVKIEDKVVKEIYEPIKIKI